MSLTIDDRTITEVNTMQKRKDKTFISKMVKTLTKLEIQYLTPRHNSKKQLFTDSPIVPDELASNYHVFIAPEPNELTVLKPFPYVRRNDVRTKPVLPNPDLCPVHTYFPDQKFHVDRFSPSFHLNYNTDQLQSLEPKNSGDGICDYPIDIVPTTINSLTNVEFICVTNDQIHAPSYSQSQTVPERNQSIITGTCKLNTIVKLPSIEDNLDDSNNDEVFSPPLTPFADRPHSQDTHYDAVEVILAEYHEVLQKCGGRGLQGGWRGRRDREHRGAPNL